MQRLAVLCPTQKVFEAVVDLAKNLGVDTAGFENVPPFVSVGNYERYFFVGGEDDEKATWAGAILKNKNDYHIVNMNHQGFGVLRSLLKQCISPHPLVLNGEKVEVCTDGVYVGYLSLKLEHLKQLVAACEALAISSKIATLIDELKDAKRCGLACKALVKIGSPAIPALIETLKNRNTYIRASAALVLQKIGNQAVPALIEALEYKTTEVCAHAVSVRMHAARTLGIIGHAKNEVILALVHALKDKNSIVRCHVCDAIAALGPSANDAISALIYTIENDANLGVRRKAGCALNQIPYAFPVLIKMIKSNH